MEKDDQYLEAIVSPLLSRPEKLHISRRIDEQGVCLEMTVDKEDMGKVIGKLGETAKGIRRLLSTFGMIHKSRVSLIINEPDGSRKQRPYQPLSDFSDLK